MHGGLVVADQVLLLDLGCLQRQLSDLLEQLRALQHPLVQGWQVVKLKPRCRS